MVGGELGVALLLLFSIPFWFCFQHIIKITYILAGQETESSNWGQKCISLSKPTPHDSLLLWRLQAWRFHSLLKTMPLGRDQMFKHTVLWGSFCMRQTDDWYVKANQQDGTGRVSSVHTAVFLLVNFEVNVYWDFVCTLFVLWVGYVTIKQCT